MKNELENSQSVFLRRSGESPVFWQPWGEEAFALAKKLNKPVFLSCGYSSCHWCRVMEAESFNNEETADFINKNFVPIKVDKDEFPDVDKKYQFYLQSTGEAGGWPLNVFLTHDKDPFYAGVYFPEKASPDKPSFRDVLANISKIWQTTPDEIVKVVQTRDEFLRVFLTPQKPLIEGEIAVKYRLSEFKKIFDTEFGGFRHGAKFPYMPALNYLLTKIDDGQIRDFLIKTADALCLSSINDHLFGGFFRYTADRKWRSPHFEKMLSDNAQNPRFLLKMFEQTGNKLYLMTAQKAIDYVIHNLMSGYGVLSSVDADSVNDKGLLSEGYFYKVTDRDFSVLSQSELQNFPIEAGLDNGVLFLKSNEYIKAAAMEVVFEKIAKRASSVKTPPMTDNKCVSGLNFMFVTTLLECFEVTGEDWYLTQATALYQKIKYLLTDGGKVFRCAYGEEVMPHLTLEDHVYYLEASLKFYELGKDKEFLICATMTANEIENMFIKNGMVYLDIANTVLDTFDDDKPNPSGQYMYLLNKYSSFLHIPLSDAFRAFAEDRASRFPTGHPTIINALEY